MWLLLLIGAAGAGYLTLGVGWTLATYLALSAGGLLILVSLDVRVPRAGQRWLVLLAAYGFLLLLSSVSHDGYPRTFLYGYLPGLLAFLIAFLIPRGLDDLAARLMLWLGLINAATAFLQLVAPATFMRLVAPVMGEALASLEFYADQGRVSGLSLTPVTLGTVLVVALSFALYGAIDHRGKRRVFSLAAAVCLSAALVTTYSRAPMAGMAFVVVVITWRPLRGLNRRLSSLAIGLLVIFLFVELAPTTGAFARLWAGLPALGHASSDAPLVDPGREHVYRVVWSHLLDSPWFGMGQDYERLLPTGFTSVHNSLLQSLLAYGVPATVALAVIATGLFVRLFAVLRRGSDYLSLAYLAAACSVLIPAAFHGVFFNFTVFSLFMACAGFGVARSLGLEHFDPISRRQEVTPWTCL